MEDIMNKGMEIWQKKQEKNKRDLPKKLKKAWDIKDGQEDICRFIEFKQDIFEIVNGKRKKTGFSYGHGLQIANKCFLTDGKFKLVNGKNFHITATIDTVPEWANDYLISLYQENDRK